ncbi:MAG: TrpB-like pyridoxal phosphate-dependent enzyme [Desulfurococcaceae archaeon]|nr:TrpB-like pyridoxal phosphate-dependent enzyme [Sulfolobales archaeon]MDW8170450.1 TrpB-like pyridoxal phosphate-dependent enzyme [Desulfurococcaceae archaeon]
MDLTKLRSPQLVDIVPKHWYNIVPDLPEPLPPMLKPDGTPVKPSELSSLFPKELVEQEFSLTKFIDIPHELRELYVELGRPTPLLRALRLEKYLDTPARIYYKYEGVLPTGSHKVNTAVAQAYFNKLDGVARLTTETGAGQWGSALALAGALFGLKIRVYMVKASYEQKPYRRVLMEIYGAEVVPSPSKYTNSGRAVLSERPDHPGSLGIAISEAIEDAVTSPSTKYSLGSVLNHVLMHQTVIGLEAVKQLELIGEELPDYVVGCVGGGSNFAGLAYPFYYECLVKGCKRDLRMIAVEPKAVPSMTRGIYAYDHGDTARLTPLIKMFTVGHKYVPAPIHAGGLRYHGLAPTLAVLVKNKVVEPRAYHQVEVFRAAQLFAQTEGVVPAPESAHAVKAVVDIALRARETGERPLIVFNMSGHGLLDLAGYQEFLSGGLKDYEPGDIDFSYLPKINY